MDHEALERMLLDANAEPTDLPISLLKSITNDFSDDQNIGSGGFADVYKGVLPNGTAVAVKRLSPQVDMDEKSFNREVISLIRVKHNNIVRFLGYCGDTQMKVQNYMGKVVMADVRQRVLCFEFMPNGCLDKYINDASKGLDWRTRYQIIKGICRGLQYLHQQNIVHLDLKPANILLGHNMVPKIADFGLSKCFDETQTRAITMNLSGSLGYMAPELLLDGVTSIKSDIYSLGIIIMQILTGKKRCPEIENVLENWRARFESSKRETWLEHVRLCAEIGTECTDFNPVKRPTARHIIERLDEIDHRYGFIETDLCTSSVTHEPQSAPRATKEYGNGDQKSRKSCFERQHENVDALIDCVGKNLGYCVGKPVAAFTICKCLLHWKSFEAEKTPVFDRLIQLIGSAIENEDDKNLAYWLSNTSSLLFILQRCFKASGAPGSVRNKAPQPTSLFARMAQGLYVPPHLPGIHVEAIGVVQKVEARYPALLFKQQLTAYLDKIYGIIRDNIKKEIASLLSLYKAPRTMKASMLRVSGRSAGQSQSQSNHWEKIIKSLDSLLMILKENYVPPVLSQKTFSQVFLYINVQLFNSLLLRRECCSFSNGEYVKAGLAELELWCAKATTEYAASSWDELKHIRQTVGFLCIFQKHRISYDQIVNDLCPILSVQQLYRICTQYWDDKYNTQSVSSDVLTHMRVVMTEDSNSAGSFLLDDDDSRIIPFSVDDITNSIQEGGFGDVKPAEELLQNPAFEFLQDYQVFT